MLMVSTSPGPLGRRRLMSKPLDVALLAGGSSASATFCFDAGMRTSSCIAVLALRMRVSMSAMGSVIIVMRSSHQLAFVRPGTSPACAMLAQADAAEPELAVHGTRPAAAAAAV